jgi:hypothetical protein
LGQQLIGMASEEIKHMKADLIFSSEETKQHFSTQMKFFDEKILKYHNELQQIMSRGL